MKINIRKYGSCFAIWYEDNDGIDGIVIAHAQTRKVAIKRGIKALERELEKLRTLGEESGK